MEPSKIKPAPIHLTLLLLNNFIVNSTNFINKFSENVENKLSSVSRKVTDVEILLSVLEAKLNSIPDLDHIKPKEVAPPVDNSSSNNNSNSSNSNNSSSSSNNNDNNSSSSNNNNNNSSSAAGGGAPPPEAAAAPSDMVKASDHPDYAHFLKMLKIGIPQPVVINKLAAAGLDTSVVENPDMLIPRNGPIPKAAAPAPASAPPVTKNEMPNTNAPPPSSALNIANTNVPPPSSSPPVTSTELTPAGQVQAGGMIKASEHPDYMSFLKMLRVGVPIPVVVGKLTAAGLNPAAASNPDMLIST